MVVTGGVVVVVVVSERLGGVVDVVVGFVVALASGLVDVVVGVVVDVVEPDGASVPPESRCGATMSLNVVPEPPESDSPRTHSTPVMATMPRTNAATVVAASAAHRRRLLTALSSGGRTTASSGAASTSSPGVAGCSGSSSETRTVAPPERPTTFARTVRTLSLVRWIDLRYSEPPTVEITLASPAPTTVPATPMVEPTTAAVTAASAPAAT